MPELMRQCLGLQLDFWGFLASLDEKRQEGKTFSEIGCPVQAFVVFGCQVGLTGSVFYFCLLMYRVISLELSASDSNCADLTMSRQQQFVLPLHKGGGRGCPGRNVYQKEKPH